MTLIENYDLSNANTLGLSSQAQYFSAFDSIEQAQSLIVNAKQNKLKIHILGGGSNLILAPNIEGLVIQSVMHSVELHKQTPEYSWVWVDAGVNWHSWVKQSIKFGHGLENLALIPGTVGASPVQNIGAYGVEVGNFIERVQWIDFANTEVNQLNAEQCQFAYRDSIFKHSLKDNCLITRVCFKLPRAFKPKLDYAPLCELMPLEKSGTLTASELIDEVCAVRNSKLPDPKQTPNAGSFFKNPIVSQLQLETLQKSYPDIPHYKHGQAFKIAAGWLIEQCGFKGQWHGKVGMYEKQALVMVAKQGASFEDVSGLSDTVKKTVFERFNLSLEAEPQPLI